MTRSSSARALRRQVKKGMLAEIKRRTGRDVSSDAAAQEMIKERIAQKMKTHEFKTTGFDNGDE